MALLNKTAYVVEKDKLIYDFRHPIDAVNLEVSVPAETAGEIKRGQVLDVASGVYGVHAKSGVPCAIAAEDTSYAADETKVTVSAYISGSFRISEVVANPELSASDLEALRSKGIYLK